MNYSWRASHSLFTGMSGTGKTTLFEKLLRKEKARWKFIYDHKAGEFSRRFGLPPCYTGDDLLAAVNRGGYVVFDPLRLFPGAFPEGFKFFCEFVFEIVQRFPGRKILATDELQKLIDAKREPRELLVCLDTGRAFQLDTFSISSAANRIHNAVRNQFTRVYAFRQIDENATKFLKEAGIDPEQIRTLSNGEYIFRDLDSGESGKAGKAF